MTRTPHSLLVRLGWVLVILLLALTACDSGDDKDSESVPTVVATITPPLTKTPIPTFTPFATSTPGQVAVLPPTATQLILQPTNIYYTATPFAPSATPYPYDVRITYPVDGSQIAGYVTIVGSASHPRFVQYALEWGPEPNPANLWYPFLSPPQRTNIVINSALGAWNTTTVADGLYRIRLHVWLNDGTDLDYVIGSIRVSNSQPTAVPTNTPTQRPNNPPNLGLLPGQQIDAGQTITAPVAVNDPDGDVVNLFVATSNPSVANAQVVSANQISVTGLAAGAATITITANDNHGGSTSTAFIVTVRGQNRPPVLSPIANQSLIVGESRDLPITVSDPDSDPLSVTSTPDNTSIATATTPNLSTVRVQGVAVGTANVTVKASDGKGGEATVIFQVVVGAGNTPPTVGAIGPQTVQAGSALDISYSASDADNDPLTPQVTSGDTGIVTASVTAPGTIRLTGVSAGSTSVALDISDGVNAVVGVSFTVTVTGPNVPPTIDIIPDQSMIEGDTLDVIYRAFDADSDPLTEKVLSSDDTIVSASIPTSGTLHLVANNDGNAVITLTVNDGVNPDVSTSFNVAVAAKVVEVNNPPEINPIGDQTLVQGTPATVYYTAVDPEGQTLLETVTSGDTNIVTAVITTPGTIELTPVNAGSTTVTLTANDGVNADVSVFFGVLVNPSNLPPVIQPVTDQTVGVGQTILHMSASDSDGGTITLSAVTNDPTIASASASGLDVVIDAYMAGSVTVFVDAEDGQGGTASISFLLTVESTNTAPVIESVAGQQVAAGPITVDLQVGEDIVVPVVIIDAEFDPIVLTAIPQPSGVVSAAALGSDTVTLHGDAPGSATVDLTADDANGGVTMASFTVNVSSAPVVGLDLMTYPVLPDAAMMDVNILSLTYGSGLGRAGAFSKVGDGPMASPNFLAPFAGDPTAYNLDSFGPLQQAVIDVFTNTPVREATDPTLDSFDVSSVAAGEFYGLDSLFDPAPSGPPCDGLGAPTILGCEFLASRPSIALISFTGANVMHLDVGSGQFQSLLNSLITDSLSTYGVIPVLATIPEDTSYSTQQLEPYNQVIVDVAEQSGVPLWNLWRAMKYYQVDNANVYNVAPDGPGDLKASSLVYGYNVRSLTAMQTLQAVRQIVGIP